MYFDEDMLLDLRLHMLNKYVKKFVITESTYLHSGKKKKLNFDYKNFIKFKDKIEYIVVDQPPSGIKNILDQENLQIKNKKTLDNSIKRENNQRNCLFKGIKNANDNDIILISDLDEIPKLENFKYNNKITIFFQKIFYYKFNLMQPDFNWMGTRACQKKKLKKFQWLRNIKGKSYPLWRIDTLFSNNKYMNLNFINDGGWHFTSIKNPRDIHYKLSNFMHHLEFEESGLNIIDMEKMIKEKKILYDHSADKRKDKYTGKQSLIKVSNEMLPEYITANLSKYKNWFD